MRLAIMQPYFFPYLGYFGLIKSTDRFILFDPVQFIRHGWIERNRILKPSEGWQYIKVPLVKHSRDTLIMDIRIRNDNNWRMKIIAQLQHYKKKAPFFKSVIEIVENSLDIETDKITELNRHVLKTVCAYLGFQRDFEIFSEMDLSIIPPEAPDEWALNICTALGNVDQYWNPSSGKSFFDKSKYDNAGIDLKFITYNFQEYDQRRTKFEAGLSIIDVMMFKEPEAINQMLDNFELL